MKLVYVWICCCWMVAAQLNDAQFTDSSTPKAQYLEGQLYEDIVLQQDNLPSDDCFTQWGCRCLQNWEFQGAQQIGCQNPDQDRAENGQLADSQNLYSYCTCRSNTFNLRMIIQKWILDSLSSASGIEQFLLAVGVLKLQAYREVACSYVCRGG